MPTNLQVCWFRRFTPRKNTWSSARLACWPLLPKRHLGMEVLEVLGQWCHLCGVEHTLVPNSHSHWLTVKLLQGKNPTQSIFLSPTLFFLSPALFPVCESPTWNYLESILLRWVFLYIYNIALLQIINSFPSLAASSTYNFGKQLE